MRGHKFIIIVGDSRSAFDNYTSMTKEIVAQIIWNEDEYLRVVTLPHEAFADNIVDLVNPDDKDESVYVVRDVAGNLWYYVDYMSKLDIINCMEQTDAS